MKNILVSIDSYKGTFSSCEINGIVKKELEKKYDSIDVKTINIADGGEGSVDALINAINGEIVRTKVMGPYGEEIESYYGIGTLNNRRIALIEVASVVGFQYKKENNDPGKVYTNGIGQLIRKAVLNGAVDIYMCLGGSISNDAGSGIACALGVDFYDEFGIRINPTGKTLKNIKYIDKTYLDKSLENVNLYCLCDVTNPFFGEKGASYVFAKQKGASEEELEELDANLRYYHEQCVKDLGVDNEASNVAGSGAAGGICYTLSNILGAKILSGIKTILELNNFSNLIKESDVVITGEGKLDSQSFDGKVISEIRNEAIKHNKKLVGIFGCSEVKEYPNINIISLFDFNDPNLKSKDYLISNTKERVKEAINKHNFF